MLSCEAAVILLDTCAIIWDAVQPAMLTEPARSAIHSADEANSLIVSDISIWEIAMLMKKGRVEINTTPSKFFTLFLQSRSVSVQSILPDIAELSVSFDSSMSNDPADRIIAATSIIHNAQLVTADQNLRNNPLINTIW